MLGADINLTCVAVGSPMPYVKWRKEPALEMTPDDKLPIALPSVPTNIQFSDVTATTVRLSWSYPSDDSMYFVIQYKPKYANQAYSEISGIITMYYTIRSL
ncbi:unnamed protein product, partial [Nesidiocoris tenuis]